MCKNAFDNLPEGAMTLREAFDHHVPPELHEEYRDAKEARDQALRKRPKRPSFFDRGSDYPWRLERHKAHIAMLETPPDPGEVINKMRDVLRKRLHAGELVALVPERPGIGPWRTLPAAIWQDARIKSRKGGVIAVDGNEHRGVRVVAAAGLADKDEPAGTAKSVRRARGRPSPMPLIREQNRERHERGVELDMLKAEARWLLDWFERTYPERKPVKLGTIQRHLSDMRKTRGK